MTDTAAKARAFVDKWQRNANNERQTAQEHFVDLCHLLGVRTPNDIGASRETYCFEKPLTKTGGGAGFADVWLRDHFAWEYKTKGKYATLREAYTQLLLYREDLGNPPILVVSDIARIEVHIAFSGYPTRVIEYANADLANVSTREVLRQVFVDPEALRPVERAESITEQAAGRFAQVARFLENRGVAPAEIAPFFMKILFALFAEDTHLLPAELMSQSLRQCISHPDQFPERARGLFRAMREGGYFGLERVPRFNGWLFNDDAVLALSVDELQYLADAARLDWAAVEPAIFGTLFERSLDPAKRSQLGAHYTSRSDILLIIEPVLMQPLRREWATAQTGIAALHAQWQTQTGNPRRRLQSVAEGMLLEFMERLAAVRVLDPACGSGNFLYVALACLKDLEKEVWTYAAGLELRQPDLGVTPAQLFGIEKNPFAAELAQVVVWIGYLQWLKNNGFLEGPPPEPILQNLHNIENRDAILAFDADGNPIEPAWPEADVIVGNPPFLGSKKLRGELGNEYFLHLRELYGERVPGGLDLVMFWFERARKQVDVRKTQRVGLLATNSIRQQRNRVVLINIKQAGDIFMAWSDRPWVLDGASVRVSMVGFDNGSEQIKTLDGVAVSNINADLSASPTFATMQYLNENANIAFMGNIKVGPFDVSAEQALEMLAAINKSGRSNADVVRPLANGEDITGVPRGEWIIDFGPTTPESEAALYEAPYLYVKQYVQPERAKNNRESYRRLWWIHGEPRPAMWKALEGKHRYIVTALVAKHRLFAWLPIKVSPAARLIVFAREDDYFLGVLHSRIHELWALRLGARHGVGNDPTYNNTTCFLPFPFPYPPGSEDQSAAAVIAIAEAARALVAQRDAWLAGGEGLGVRDQGSGARGDGAANEHASAGVGVPDPRPLTPDPRRTLTNLYNKRPDWLDQAHAQLDAAVFAAYGWPNDLSDEAILERLLALNLARAAG